MIKDYIQLTKPRITWLILASTAVGYFFGSHAGWNWWVLFHTLAGTGLLASGTAALNQWWERAADAQMNRTKKRPLPEGRISAAGALTFGIGLSILGFAELWFGVNALSAWLGLLTLASYLFLYTPLKRISPHSTTVGAFPGAMPPLIGYAAASGALTWEGLVLFAILFLWQFPHFYAIAWMYREDYSRAGIRMLPVIDSSGERTVRQILIYSLILIPVSLIPRYLNMAGNVYLLGALVLGIFYFYAGVRVARDRTRAQARQVLLASIVYLPLLYGLMLADRPML
ncbi:MAG TPA: heme o synthase [Bryobacteraceae bacterium]|nr:heme o synthase [Bryobacteraceae bacterium]